MDIPSITTSASSTSENHSRFIERWTLAVFYYSTSGPIWRYNLKFMEPIDHCDWYETFIDTTGSIVRMGVTLCERLGTGFGEQQNEDQMVSRIELCKFYYNFILCFNNGLLIYHCTHTRRVYVYYGRVGVVNERRDTLFCTSRLKKKTENSYIFKILTLLLLSAQYYYYQPPLSNRQLTMDWQEAFQYKCNTFIDWKT